MNKIYFLLIVLSPLILIGTNVLAVTIDDTPFQFDGNKELIINATTTGRTYCVYSNNLLIYSNYPTFYNSNLSDLIYLGHLIVNENLSYLSINSINASIHIIPIDDMVLNADRGSVTVQMYKYEKRHIQMLINSSYSDSIFNITLTGRTPGKYYYLGIDTQIIDTAKVGISGQIEFSYWGDWSEHELEIFEYVYITTFDILVLIILLTIGIVLFIIGLIDRKFFVFSGLIWIFGALVIMPLYGIGWIIIILGFGLILLIEGGLGIIENEGK